MQPPNGTIPVQNLTLSDTHKADRVPILELFGPTIQGEGLMSGTFSHFLRLGGCSLRCTWCDSMYAVDPRQVQANAKWQYPHEIIHDIRKMAYAPYVTLTGGDPAIWKPLGDLIPELNRDNIRVAVETQGMHFPEWFEEVDVLTFSPKPPSSGNVVDYKVLTEWLVKNVRSTYRGRICIKVVVFDGHDLEYAINVYKHIPHVLYDAFYFTSGTEVGKLTGLFAPTARALGVVEGQRDLANALLTLARQGVVKFNDKTHVGCQQHVLLWPEKDKGV